MQIQLMFLFMSSFFLFRKYQFSIIANVCANVTTFPPEKHEVRFFPSLPSHLTQARSQNDGTGECSREMSRLVRLILSEEVPRYGSFLSCSWHWNCMLRWWEPSAAERRLWRRAAHVRSEREKWAGSGQKAKIIFSFLRNSSKICNRNREQKYVKTKRAAENWLIKI